MTITTDRTRVKASFDKYASQYDQYSSVQKRVIRELFHSVESRLDQPPFAILDVGCGTGELLSLLHELYPAAELCGIDLSDNMIVTARHKMGEKALLVSGDAEDLPFADSTFDLLVSTSTLQWLPTLSRFIDEAFRVLNPGGLMCVAFFAGDTLKELHNCFRCIAEKRGEPHDFSAQLHKFHTFDDLNQMLQNSNFEQIVLSSEVEIEWYADLNEMLRAIKKIGAGGKALNSNCSGGLGWRGILQEISKEYSKLYEVEGKIPAKYEVFYVVAKKR